MKKYLACFVFTLFTMGIPYVPVSATSMSAEGLIKGSGSEVYWFATDGKRYVFPNEKTFGTWFPEPSVVITGLTDAELGSIAIGGNMTYKPAVRMIKITTDPKVYAVDKQGMLRWVTTEDIARTLYGIDWNTKIDDVPDEFFTNYTVGQPITAPSQFSVDTLRSSFRSPAEDIHARVKQGTSVSPISVSAPTVASPPPSSIVSVPPPVPASPITVSTTGVAPSPPTPVPFSVVSTDVTFSTQSAPTDWSMRDATVVFSQGAAHVVFSLTNTITGELVAPSVPYAYPTVGQKVFVHTLSSLKPSTTYAYTVSAVDSATGLLSARATGSFKTDGPTPTASFAGVMTLTSDVRSVKSGGSATLTTAIVNPGFSTVSVDRYEILDDQGRVIQNCGHSFGCSITWVFETVTQPTVKQFTARAFDIWSRQIQTSSPLQITIDPSLR